MAAHMLLVMLLLMIRRTLRAVSVLECGCVAQGGCSVQHGAHQLRLQWLPMHAACVPYLVVPAPAPQS
eukprot:6260849-Alexandrium_andersonii.AAC.1